MDQQFVEVKFLDWMAHPPEDDPVLLLHAEEVNRIIPIWVDIAAATEYSARETGTTQRRPGMHEVFADTLDLVGHSALCGQITGLHEGVFIASLILEGGIEIDMRPSDLILIANEVEVPLYIARDVIDEASVPAHLVATNGGSLADNSEADSVEASVEEFAEFLDSIDADYFADPSVEGVGDEATGANSDSGMHRDHSAESEADPDDGSQAGGESKA